MKPSVVLLGLLLGSSAAITFSLTGVSLVFLILEPEYPRLDAEIWPLLKSLALFTGLTALSAFSFFGVVKAKPWRRAVTALTLIVLALVAWQFRP
jgi:hypothetical protein